MNLRERGGTARVHDVPPDEMGNVLPTPATLNVIHRRSFLFKLRILFDQRLQRDRTQNLPARPGTRDPITSIITPLDGEAAKACPFVLTSRVSGSAWPFIVSTMAATDTSAGGCRSTYPPCGPLMLSTMPPLLQGVKHLLDKTRRDGLPTGNRPGLNRPLPISQGEIQCRKNRVCHFQRDLEHLNSYISDRNCRIIGIRQHPVNTIF